MPGVKDLLKLVELFCLFVLADFIFLLFLRCNKNMYK